MRAVLRRVRPDGLPAPDAVASVHEPRGGVGRHATPRRRWALVAVVAGLLALQACWILSLRPFAGIDEFAHAYRAASVARGQWAPTPAPAVHDTGAWVKVPSGLVDAARPECRSLPYTAPAECAGHPADPGNTWVASSAGRYNPLFYALVGYPSLLFHGAGALLAMRVVAALACCLVLALAVAVAARHARTRWLASGVLLSCTPVVIYSSAVAAPNALEICAGICLWVSLLCMFRDPSRRPDRLVTSATILSGVLLGVLRSLGPMWLVLIVALAVLATRLSRASARELLRHARTRWTAVAVGLAGAAGLAWTLLMGSMSLGASPNHGLSTATKLHESLVSVPLWFLQSIAAFPYRNEPTAPAVYACYLVLGVGIAALCLSHRHGAPRSIGLAWWAVTGLGVLIPVAATVRTIERYGVAWQGRYGLPLTVGVILLLAFALDRSGVRLGARVFVPAVGLFAGAQVTGLVDTLLKQLASDPTHGGSAWLAPSAPVVGLISVVAVVVTACGTWRLATRAETSPGTSAEPARDPSGAMQPAEWLALATAGSRVSSR